MFAPGCWCHGMILMLFHAWLVAAMLAVSGRLSASLVMSAAALFASIGLTAAPDLGLSAALALDHIAEFLHLVREGTDLIAYIIRSGRGAGCGTAHRRTEGMLATRGGIAG